MPASVDQPPKTLAAAPSGRWSFLERTGAWFWCAVALGVGARLFLALATRGTTDVQLWTEHAEAVSRAGLADTYARSPMFNHPPFIGWVMARLWEWARDWGIAFRQLYRPLVAAADLGSAALLWIALRGSPRQALSVALYCLAPVALVLAGQHGNTDAIIGCGLLGCTLLVARERPLLAGALLGCVAWIKLPGLLAAPAIGFALPRWRDRFACAGVALAVAALGYAPAYVQSAQFAAQHPELVRSGMNALVERVFGYQGLYLHTTGQPPTFVWGLKNFLFRALGDDPRRWPAGARWWVEHSHQVALALMLAFAFLRRRERSALGLGATIALSYALFYGLVETWAFQYFAWSMALWMLAGPRFALGAHLLGGGFLYALYAVLCGDWLLRPQWDFVGHPYWPVWLTWLRDAAVLFFVLFGLAAFARALATELAQLRAAR